MIYLLILSIFCDITLSDVYVVGSVTPRTIILLILVSLIFISNNLKINLPKIKDDRNLVIVLIAFLIWIWIYNTFLVIVGVMDYFPIRYFLGKLISPFLIFISIYYAFRNSHELHLFLIISIMIMSLSSFVAYLQVSNPYLGYSLKPAFVKLLGFKIGSTLREGSRTGGLAAGAYSVPYSYQVVTFIPVIFSYIYIFFRKSKLVLMLLLMSLTVNLLGLLMSAMRSGLVGISVGLMVMFLVIYRGKTGILLRISLAFTVVFVILYSVYNYIPIVKNYYKFIYSRFTQYSFSDFERFNAMKIGVNVFWNNPMGYGLVYSYNDIVDNLRSDLIDYSYIPVRGPVYLSSHNQIINTGLRYGFVGLFVLLYIYFLLFKGFLESPRKNADMFILRIGILGGILANFINSMFHNAGLFNSDYIVWYFIGLYFVIKRLEASA